MSIAATSLTTRELSSELYDSLGIAHPPSTPVRVEEMGSGEPVVFLHGLLGINDHWKPMATHLAGRARCIMIEAPLLELKGSLCSVDGVTAVISGTLDHVLDGQPAVLVGNSLGGHVAQRLAISRPDVCRGLVLAGSSGLFERTLEKNVQHRPSREWIERKILDLFYDPAKVPPDCVDKAYEELSQRHGARAIVKLGRSAKADHMGERLHLISQPTLLLWGRQDNVTPPMVADEFHELIRDTRLVWLEECGHTPMLEHPELFAKHLHTFLDELDASGADASKGRTKGDARDGRQEVA